MKPWRPATMDEARRQVWDQDDWEEGIAYCLDRIEPIITDQTGFRVLDYGCGVGRITLALSLAHPKIWPVGVDTSLEMITFARERCGLEFHLAPKVIPAMDAAFSCLVWQHLNRRQRMCALADITRSLVLGGRFRLQYVDGDRSRDEGPLHHPITSVDLAEECELFGLHVVSVIDDPQYQTWSWATIIKEGSV